MGLIVQKFGGTSVGSVEKFKMRQTARLQKTEGPSSRCCRFSYGEIH